MSTNKLQQTKPKTNIQILEDMVGNHFLKVFTFDSINRLNLKDGKVHNFLYDPESGIIISIKEHRRGSEKLMISKDNIKIYTFVS